MSVTRRKHSADAVLIILAVMIAVMGALFIFNIGGGMAGCSVIFAIFSIAAGMGYMVYGSSASAANKSLEWPMLQGLIDILLGIVLLMSASTSNTVMIVYIMAIWAAMGAVARLLNMNKLKGSLKNATKIGAFFCLGGAVVMLLGAILGIEYTLCTGIGLIIFALGSFTFTKKRRA